MQNTVITISEAFVEETTLKIVRSFMPSLTVEDTELILSGASLYEENYIVNAEKQVNGEYKVFVEYS